MSADSSSPIVVFWMTSLVDDINENIHFIPICAILICAPNRFAACSVDEGQSDHHGNENLFDGKMARHDPIENIL